jgi:hypothetical protein
MVSIDGTPISPCLIIDFYWDSVIRWVEGGEFDGFMADFKSIRYLSRYSPARLIRALCVFY